MRLKTFGRPHVVDATGEEVALQPLPVAVLAYLAVGGPRDRQHLADLFWHNNKNGLNSLSTTLNRIRADVPDAVWVRGTSLVGTELQSDVAELRAAIDAADFDQIADIYRAPFLGSLKLRRQNAEFDEWVLSTRTTLASTVELTLLHRSRDLHDRGDHRSAAAVAETAWEIAVRDGFPSPDYFDTYHRILASAARPRAHEVRSMASEFGVELSVVEPAVFDSAESSKNEAALSADQLFGRIDELDAAARSVVSQRVTTLVGLGGSGKTRLATEIFDSPATKRDFVDRHWVNLRDIEGAELVAPAIAAVLGQSFVGVPELADHLAHDDPVLLVLDNFEHVLGAADMVRELAQANPALRILVTSRVPLDVGNESLVSLGGLTIDGHESNSPAELLFAAAARRAGADEGRIGAKHRDTIREVCRQVGGNPLALEIAGGWVHVLSASEILEALALGTDLLSSPLDGEERSVDLVLEQSWSMLTEADQRTLMLLAAFPAGLLTKEALKLSELSIRSVRRLVKSSLVRMHTEGRITLHPLIARHASARLEALPSLNAEFHRVVSDWCERFSADLQADGPDGSIRFSPDYGPEVANFVTAWQWAVKQRHWQLHRSTVSPLRTFFSQSGRGREGRALFLPVVDELRRDPNGPQDLVVRLLEALGRFAMATGDLQRAQVHLDDALDRSSEADPRLQAELLQTIGMLQLTAGEVEAAVSNLQAGVALVADESSTLAASLRYDLAQAHHYRGEREQAATTAREALQVGRSAGDQVVMTMSYLLLADIEVESEPERAIVLLNEGWEIAREASLDSLAIYFPHILGLAHLSLGQAEVAARHFSDGLDAANEIGRLQMACANHVGRAEAQLLAGSGEHAVADLRTGIRLALKANIGRYLMWAAVVSCRAAGDHPGARVRELLQLVQRHPTTDREAQDKATDLLARLSDESWQPEEAGSADQPASLDEIAERALHVLGIRG